MNSPEQHAGIDWPTCTRCGRTMLWPPGIARGVCSLCDPPTADDRRAAYDRALARIADMKETT